MIPWSIRDSARAVLSFPRRLEKRRQWSGIRLAGCAEPVLGLGGLLDPGRFVHGGAVKLLSLRDAFPSGEREFNILYLVSSAQPEFAEELVAACRGKGIKFVWNQNGVGYPAWAGDESERHNAPMRRLRASADFIVYQSEFCRRSAEKFLGPSGTPSEVLLNPVDLKKFAPRRGARPQGPLRLLAMGTQNYRARAAAVLACARALRDAGSGCSVTIAGPLLWEGADSDLRALARELGLAGSVSFLPRFTQEEAPEIYRAHDVLVHPKYLDPCPTVVAEALACGLPVVGSRSGGLPEMTSPQCASLVDVPVVWEELITPSGDELARGVQALAEDLPSASAAARARATELFDSSAWSARHGEIFRSLLR